MNGYYGNRDQECFLCSSANLFINQFNDRSTAQRIIEEGRKHPLVDSHGATHMPSWPTLVRDLTCGEYLAFLHIREKYATPLFRGDEHSFGRKALRRYRKAVRGDITKGYIIPVLRKRDMPDIFPRIIGVDSDISKHAVLQISSEGVIDEGVEESFSYDAIYAVLRVERN